MREEDTLRGEVIVIYRDSEKIEVHGAGSEIRLGADTVNNLPKEDEGKKASDKKDDAGKKTDDSAQNQNKRNS